MLRRGRRRPPRFFDLRKIPGQRAAGWGLAHVCVDSMGDNRTGAVGRKHLEEHRGTEDVLILPFADQSGRIAGAVGMRTCEERGARIVYVLVHTTFDALVSSF